MTTLPPPLEPSPGQREGGGSGQLPPSTDADAVLEEAALVLDSSAESTLEVEMDHLDNPRRLLLVHAHPDDETIGNGATMAKYAAEGAHVTLVTCTLGEEGEVLVPDLEHLAAAKEDTLGRHRIGELSNAMEALGLRDFRFLGGPARFRDSGMMGEPANERPDAFWQADLDEAGGLLADILREVRPQVVVTYDENGGYGHPDHIQAHRTTMRAVELAADPAHGTGEPWQVGKVYYNGMPKSALRAAFTAMREHGLDFFGMQDVDEVPFAIEDDLITAVIDGGDHLTAKYAAMRAHATQIRADGPFFALSGMSGDMWAHEYYQLVRGEPGLRGPDGWETDLFSGVV